MRFLFRACLVVTTLTVLAPAARAQAYVTTTAHRIPPERLDSLKALIRASQPAVEEAKRRGGIVEVHWLIHEWGGEYNAIEVITWSSWAAIGNPALNVEGSYPTLYPDPAVRKRIEDAWAWVFQGVHHEDGIYRKYP